MSGNLTAVSEMSGKCQGKNLVRESNLTLFIVSCIIASILDFAEFVHFILGFGSCTVAFIPPTDNNTSTGNACYE